MNRRRQKFKNNDFGPKINQPLFTCHKTAEPPRRDKLLLTTRLLGVTGTQLIDIGRMKR